MAQAECLRNFVLASFRREKIVFYLLERCGSELIKSSGKYFSDDRPKPLFFVPTDIQAFEVRVRSIPALEVSRGATSCSSVRISDSRGRQRRQSPQ